VHRPKGPGGGRNYALLKPPTPKQSRLPLPLPTPSKPSLGLFAAKSAYFAPAWTLSPLPAPAATNP